MKRSGYVLALALTLLSSCQHRRKSFGDFAAIRTEFGRYCYMRGDDDNFAATNGTMTCEIVDDASQSALPCRCTGSVELHRDVGSNAVTGIDLRMTHCPRATIVGLLDKLFDDLVAKDERANFDHDIADPTGGSNAARYVSTKRVYGDVEIDSVWSADFYRDAGSDATSGSGRDPIKALGLKQLAGYGDETYVVALTLRGDDGPATREVSNDPRITERPPCRNRGV